jgi:hypothetical protein
MANVYTTVGKAFIVDLIDGTVSVASHFGAWGTGAGTAGVGDTTLFTEAAEARVATTKSQPAADTNQWVWTTTSASAQTITNAGVFSASTGGTLLIKGDFAGVALAINDQIQFTATLQQT